MFAVKNPCKLLVLDSSVHHWWNQRYKTAWHFGKERYKMNFFCSCGGSLRKWKFGVSSGIIKTAALPIEQSSQRGLVLSLFYLSEWKIFTSSHPRQALGCRKYFVPLNKINSPPILAGSIAQCVERRPRNPKVWVRFSLETTIFRSPNSSVRHVVNNFHMSLRMIL